MRDSAETKILPTIRIKDGKIVSKSGDELSVNEIHRIIELILNEGWNKFAVIDDPKTSTSSSQRTLISNVIKKYVSIMQGKCCVMVNNVKNSDEAQYYIDHGINWIVCRTSLACGTDVLQSMLARFKEHMIAALDIKDGMDMAKSWVRPYKLTAIESAQLFSGMGFKKLFINDHNDYESLPMDINTYRSVYQNTKMNLIVNSLHGDSNQLMSCLESEKAISMLLVGRGV